MKTKYLAPAIAVLAFQSVLPAAEVKKLTITEAVDLALQQNRMVKIARLQVQENQEKKAAAKSLYFPTLKNESNVLHISELQNITIPTASFGVIPGVIAFPQRDIVIDQGKQTLIASGTSLVQPLTQLLRIRQENKIVQAEVATSQSEVKRAEVDVALKVHDVYYTLLVAELNRRAAQEKIAFAEKDLQESADDVRNGAALKVAEIGSQAGLLESKHSLLTVELQIADLTAQFNDLLGLPLDTKLELDPEVKTEVLLPAKDQCLRMAWAENPEIRSAEQTVRKASAAVGADQVHPRCHSFCPA
jgi:outer membrane protein TolC